ncbi:hypothetical protein SAMN05216243_1796 [Sediminibacillus albus]|uniref:Uncharacterized protein n=1 Tax=Sediminibacillus albus TaxID=407036 RepID=A0A1G8YS85_9BACI|nr:hypothetical protein SAMN05216243_1796 [Sediminibacillus albus]
MRLSRENYYNLPHEGLIGETRVNREKTRDLHEKDPEIGKVYFH